MTLTRRLYELDEVISTFMLSLRKYREEESLFWLEELTLSAEDEHASAALFYIWFLRSGISCWSFWIDWKRHKDSIDGRYALVKAWCKNKTLDSTLWRSYCLGFATNKAWDTSLSRKPALDWWARASCSPFECAEHWYKYMASSINSHKDHLNLIPIEICYDVKNIREARRFSIPYECHVGQTRRGLMWNSSKILCDVSLYSLLASPIWAGILDDYVSSDNEWIDDEKKEAFYTKFFGESDIPDEWSLADREKSHGQAPSVRSSCPLIRWWSSWVPSEHKYIYGRADAWLMDWVRTTKVNNVFDDLANIKMKTIPRTYDLCTNKLIIYTD
jgi:hypothetical protein